MKTLKHVLVLAATAITVFWAASAGYAEKPKVVKAVPDNGQRNVDPALKQVRIEFDQDMSGDGYSICGGGPKFPKTTGKPKWINKRTLVLPVKLQPNREYEMSVNCPSYNGCRNAEGEPAEIYPIKFRTAANGKGADKQSQSPSILLQEGLHAEETEGNLDKAMEIYNQIREEYNEVERVSAQATFHLGLCYLKKGEKEKALKYFQETIDYFPEQKTMVQKAQAQLDELGVNKTGESNLFNMLGPNVCSYLGSKYGEICEEARAKQLYSSSHVYFVDRDFVLRTGGMGYIYNHTDQPITKRYPLGGTSYPSQKRFDFHGSEMNIEMVHDEQREDFYHVYWNPKEPLEPNETFNYRWVLGGSRALYSNKKEETGYFLTMQNHLGNHAYETFFLVVPKGTIICKQSEEYTKMENYENWDVYWWKKEVTQDENHVVRVQIEEMGSSETKKWAQELVEDFFQHNYRDITSRKTIEWGTPITDANGNVSINYKYEMIIWDKDKFLANKIFAFDKNGRYLKVDNVEGFPIPLGKIDVAPEDVSTKENVQKLVEKFFSRNYHDITYRKTIEWGELNKDLNGNVSIRYKFEVVIWNRDKMIMNKVFTFDKNGEYVSATDVEGFPIKIDSEAIIQKKDSEPK